ncbi:MAG: DUF547 domain-containing protein [Prochloraceae cyanobacterium]|nr:DUF547 domain-containing protein [Prochloraceae cyanobacterium]
MLDFQIYDRLLKKYVDNRGRIDYQTWKIESQDRLNLWLKESARINLSQCDRNERLAFWINLYNGLVIAEILKIYPIASIFPKLLGLPNPIAFFWFFSRPIYVGYSLNGIEHAIIRPRFRDPQIHFALVCAALGCPILRNEAYTPDNLESQLDEDCKRFINNPNKVYYDTENKILYCSKIFKWYGNEFLAVANSIPEYIQTYLSPDLGLNASTAVKYLDYDWNLNQRISS